MTDSTSRKASFVVAASSILISVLALWLSWKSANAAARSADAAQQSYRLQQQQFEAQEREAAFRMQPFVMFESGDVDRPSLKNFGEGPALHISVQFDDFKIHQRASPEHLFPKEDAKLTASRCAPDGKSIAGIVTIRYTDPSRRKHSIRQEFTHDRTQEGRSRWTFKFVERLETLGAEGLI